MAQASKTQTSTQIRNLYAEGMCYLNIKFYNTNLKFQFAPFMGKDQVGRASYDTKNAKWTSINYESAYALYQVCLDILNEKVPATSVTLQCPQDTKLTLNHSTDATGIPKTVFSIENGGIIIPFQFKTMEQMVLVNGVPQPRIVHVGLGVFAKTLEGYLTGINADRHLNKLTEDYIASQNQNGQSQYPQQQKSYNGGYRKPYPQKQPFNQQRQWQQPQQQNLSDYQFPN